MEKIDETYIVLHLICLFGVLYLIISIIFSKPLPTPLMNNDTWEHTNIDFPLIFIKNYIKE